MCPGSSSSLVAQRLPHRNETVRGAGRSERSVGFEITRLAILDVASVVVAAILAKIICIDWLYSQNQDLLPYLWPSAPLSIALYCFGKQMRLLDVDTLLEPTVGYGQVWGALAMSFLIALGSLYIFKVGEFYSRGWVLSWFALSAILLIWVRRVAMRRLAELSRSGQLCQRVGLFGDPALVGSLRRHIEQRCRHTEVVAAYSAVPLQSEDGREFDGGMADLRAALEAGAFDKVIIGMPANDVDGIRNAVRNLASFSTELLLCTDLESVPVELHGARVVAGLRADILNPVPAAESDRLLKSVLDYAVAILAAVALAPLSILVAIAIKLDSRGPVLFLQRRYGRNNRVFRIFKFRTMTVTEDGPHIEQAQRDDPRVTRVGALLRATSIDELPQLINVLRGEMSIVGPRPHALAHDERFEQDIDFFASRRCVLPGLTGWAQVNGYRGETRTHADISGRMAYDRYYIRHWSIWFDIEIMVRTIVTVLRGAH